MPWFVTNTESGIKPDSEWQSEWPNAESQETHRQLLAQRPSTVRKLTKGEIVKKKTGTKTKAAAVSMRRGITTEAQERMKAVGDGALEVARQHAAKETIAREGGIIATKGPYRVIKDHNQHVAIRTTLPEDQMIAIIVLAPPDGIQVLELSSAAYERAGWKPYEYPISKAAEKFVEYSGTYGISDAARDHLAEILGRKIDLKAKEPVVTPMFARKARETVANGNAVSLKKICQDADLDPRVARRLLRSKGKRPTGRWEWDPKDVPEIVAFLKAKKGDE